jgi:acetyl/propionyl-CoA carboxylase alpha subunit
VHRKILIANRGEIACRILRTCKRLGIATVAVYSDADAEAPHVKLADEAVRIGPAPVKESYLQRRGGARCREVRRAPTRPPGLWPAQREGLVRRGGRRRGAHFIGPPPAVLDAFRRQDQGAARRRARWASSPRLAPTDPIAADDRRGHRRGGRAHRLPLLVKAAGGGGGIGMQIVEDASKLARAVQACSDRGRSAFADARVYMERWSRAPKHIEVQVLCDAHGGGVALGERECSAQRRHQKIVEESPSPAPFFAGEAGEARRQKLLATRCAS